MKNSLEKKLVETNSIEDSEKEELEQIDKKIEEIKEKISKLKEEIESLEEEDMPQNEIEEFNDSDKEKELEESNNLSKIIEKDLEEVNFKEEEKRVVKKATLDQGRIISDKQAEKIKSSLSAKFKNVINKIRTKIKYFVYGAVVTGAFMGEPEFVGENFSMLTYKLNEEGLINVEEIEVVEDEEDYKETLKDNKNTFFQIISTVPDKNDFYTNSENTDSLFSYRSQWNNKDGFIYIATPNKKGRGGNAFSTGRNITYDNVIGVGHFLIDTDIKGNNRTISLNRTRNDQYVPVFTTLESSPDGDKVRLNYIKKENLPKNDSSYLTPTPLLQWKVSDINWNSEVRARGFKTAKEVVTKTGENTGIIFKDKNTLSRFSGNSVVFIFQDSLNNTIVRDFTGSFNQIVKEIKNIKNIKNEFNVDDNQITIGRYDAGSFSAKPKANNGKLETDRWNNYNPSDGGTTLIIPKNQDDEE